LIKLYVCTQTDNSFHLVTMGDDVEAIVW
jgi:hypothetical protein